MRGLTVDVYFLVASYGAEFANFDSNGDGKLDTGEVYAVMSDSDDLRRLGLEHLIGMTTESMNGNV